mmetsp:Transcript_10518/g.15789  ORF Transcript_10518/g.15789 Transcript_10518/m.15789 type:complete len:352 (-) Transcript_10518:19-1074(-)
MQRRTTPSNPSLEREKVHTAGAVRRSFQTRSSGAVSYHAVLIFALVLGLVGFIAITKGKEGSSAMTELQEARTKMMQLQQHYDRMKETMNKNEGNLRKQLEDAKTAKANGAAKKTEEDKNEVKNLRTTVTEMNSRIAAMQNEIQRHSKHDVLEQFGEGPYQVEFTLEFPLTEDGEVEEGPTVFVAEMAPLDLMPHSVHLFLEWVGHDLLAGSSFHRNARHVIQAGPSPYFANSGTNVRKGYVENRLTSVSFQEYSPEFPHVKYTMGFAGRPGGPDWYVSTMDNTSNHGPGGQASYALASEADPCFAKVISGFDAVDRVHEGAVKPGWYNGLEKNVGIKKVRLLPKDELISS